MDTDVIALLFLVVLVVVILASPPGPGTPKRIRVTF
jgi:hypothetical protein